MRLRRGLVVVGLTAILAGCGQPKPHPSPPSPKQAVQVEEHDGDAQAPVAGATEASGPAFSTAFYECRDRAIFAGAGPDPACYQAERKRWDERLDYRLQIALARLDSAGQARLRQDQASWVAAEPKACSEREPKGAIPPERHERARCELERTAKRVVALAQRTEAGPARYPEPALSAVFELCMERDGSNTAGARDCYAEEWRQWDARLKQNYEAALDRLDTTGRAGLEAEQRRWRAERKLACDNVSEALGGTLELLETDDCYLDWTARRAEWLAAQPRKG